MKLCPRCSESFADDAGFCPFDGTKLDAELRPARRPHARGALPPRAAASAAAAWRVVYLARHVMIDRLSAIKMLRRDLAMSASHRERFLREARAVNRINHPNIVEITDFGESDGPGVPRHGVRRGRVAHRGAPARAASRGRAPRGSPRRSPRRWPARTRRASSTATSSRRTCSSRQRNGEDFVEAHRLRHRQDPRRAGAHASASSASARPGTSRPSTSRGRPAGPLGDLYALGVVLYEMLTGAMPFDSQGAELLVAPLREAPVKPSAQDRGHPRRGRGARPAPARAPPRRAPARRVRGGRRAGRRPAPPRPAPRGRPPPRTTTTRGAPRW